MKKSVLKETPDLAPTPTLDHASVERARKKMFTSKEGNRNLLETLKGNVKHRKRKRKNIIDDIRNKNQELTKKTTEQKKEIDAYRQRLSNK